jgi:hypothetical protein
MAKATAGPPPTTKDDNQKTKARTKAKEKIRTGWV